MQVFDIESITKTELSKLTELINKIKDYKKSNKFQDKLCEAVKKDKNLSIKEKHNNIQICYDKFNKEFPPKKVLYYYDKSYNEFPSEKVYSSFMSNNGEINEKLVQDISNKNIDDIRDIVLNLLKNSVIEDQIYEIYYNYGHWQERQTKYGRFII